MGYLLCTGRIELLFRCAYCGTRLAWLFTMNLLTELCLCYSSLVLAYLLRGGRIYFTPCAHFVVDEELVKKYY